jgi:twinkle protein
MVETTDDSNFLRHEPCESCGSSDAKAVYDDGHSYCFACEHHEKGDGKPSPTQPKQHHADGFVHGSVTALNKRGISRETCALWGYEIADYKGQKVQVANYKDANGEVVFQKIRFPNKDFLALGNSAKAGLYGMHLWKDGGKLVTVVEGEVDALSLSQAQNNKWAVVSIPNGAQGAAKSIRKNIDWLEKFETVVFMFDNDKHGIEAAMECAALISPKKAKIASLPLKDANEMLVAGRSQELLQAMWNAKSFRPDGILQMGDLWERIATPKVNNSFSYPFDGLNDKTLGLRKGEICTITAGSGIGKSQICREIAYHLIEQKLRIGYIALEESVERTSLGLMSIAADKPLHLCSEDKTQYKDIFDKIAPYVDLYDHWGSTDSDNLMNRIRYMVRGSECDFIILDHISIVVSGIDEGDERRLIDNTMTRLRALVEELKCGMILVSHLKRPPQGKGHEEGAATRMSQLRGSAAIGQLSDIVIGAERDQQSDTPDITTLRVLKNRFTGETGVATRLRYTRETGRLREATDGDTGVFAFDYSNGEANGEF